MRAVQSSFAEEFERVLVETDTSVRRLSRLSGVPRRTLENWLYGRTLRPRFVEPVLETARALKLPAHDVDNLLRAAGHPTLDSLKHSTELNDRDLLADWQVAPDILLGQKSAAFPAQNNLPAAATPFLGREKLREGLETIIRRPDLRLITITGLGGTGKTRLALESARRLAGWFDHGVYFIPLDEVDTAAGFWEALLQGLQAPGDGVVPAHELVHDYLRDKQILLILDNFEHLMFLAPQISRLLAQSQRLNLLVTSRQALDLRAEQNFPIGGLAFVQGPESPAFDLFIRTARRRVPHYEAGESAAADILALCEAVDGLPLALELAASWMDLLSPGQILDHLQSNLHEIWHGSADRPYRQQSLWNLFEYSWQMFSAKEQEAAIRLGVIRGTFSQSTALDLARCSRSELRRLLHNSFLSRTSDSRLMFHPLVRQFLAEKALQQGYNVEELDERFMEVILAWAAQEARRLRETFKTSHYQNLLANWPLFERAWWLAVNGRRYDLLVSCWDILTYFEVRGSWPQGSALFETTRVELAPTTKLMQAYLDAADAFLTMRLYNIPQAIRLAERSLETLQELQLDTAIEPAGRYARLVHYTSALAFRHGDFDDTIARELRAVSAGYFDRFADITIQLGYGVQYFTKADYEQASRAFRLGLDVSGPDAYVVAMVHCYLGLSLSQQERLADAQEQFSLALKKGLELQVYPAVVVATYEQQYLAAKNPSYEQCRAALEALALEMGSRRTVGNVANIVAVQYLNLGQNKKARQLTRIGLAMVWDEVGTAERARILSTTAQVYIAFGLIQHAPQLLSLVAPKGEHYFDQR